jgi:hypothetical protein
MAISSTSPPDGLNEQTADWHMSKIVEFTRIKLELGEPSPHLSIVGYLSRDRPIEDRLWLLGTYAATYCLPTAQVIWELWPWDKVKNDTRGLGRWLADNWSGIVTRQERRCVRTVAKMHTCLTSYVDWVKDGYERLVETVVRQPSLAGTAAYYDIVWESVSSIKYFGRYINIRLVEGLRRYAGIPANLYDIRSIGGWSPKKALCYLYPNDSDRLLVDDKEGNALTDQLARQLLDEMRRRIPSAMVGVRRRPEVNEYIMAAMLCEYKGAFEKRHQYPGWTIDQEPLLYDKVIDYWGNVMDLAPLWRARSALFPLKVLGEKRGWNGTRWEAAKVLRDYGYNWSDVRYDYVATLKSRDFSRPRRWCS